MPLNISLTRGSSSSNKKKVGDFNTLQYQLHDKEQLSYNTISQPTSDSPLLGANAGLAFPEGDSTFPLEENPSKRRKVLDDDFFMNNVKKDRFEFYL